jgi:hypothetical protein
MSSLSLYITVKTVDTNNYKLSTQENTKVQCSGTAQSRKQLGYGLGDHGTGVQLLLGATEFCFLQRPEQLWGSTNHLSNAYQELFTQS